jgi:hypothetical protein
MVLSCIYNLSNGTLSDSGRSASRGPFLRCIRNLTSDTILVFAWRKSKITDFHTEILIRELNPRLESLQSKLLTHWIATFSTELQL